MGAWGIKYFDNDDAGDFISALADSGNWSTVREAFEAVLAVGDEYLDLTEASAAIAAAAVVACKKSGLVVSDFPDDHEAMRPLGTPPQDLVSLALRALARVQTEPSELMGLWDEAGEKDEWVATLTVLEKALQ